LFSLCFGEGFVADLKGLKSLNRNRNRLDIVRDMLAVATIEAKKTRIMYQANLNYFQAERYLKMLLEEGLLGQDGDSCYLITEKGRQFLSMYNDYFDRCRRIKEDVSGTVKHRLLLENMCFNGKDGNDRTKIGKDVLADIQAE
jgi:predicted transcriptional regulator